MKTELSGTWPTFTQFYHLSIGKSGLSSYVIELGPLLKNKNPSVEIGAVPESIKSSLEESALGKVSEVRGMILLKLILLTQSKDIRTPLLEFLVLLLNNEVYPKSDMKNMGNALAALCFGLGNAIHNDQTLSPKDILPKFSLDKFPGATRTELEVLTSKDASRLVPLFLQVYKLSVQ
jgi:hypothetical protein